MSTTPPPEDPEPPTEDPKQQNWWQRRGKGGKAAVVIGALFAVLVVIGAIAPTSEETATDQAGGTTAREAPPEPKALTIERVNEAGQTFAKRSVEITGIVSEPRATISATPGSSSDTASPTGRFSLRVRLSDIGRNELKITANKPGFKSDTMEFAITRERTDAEQAALAERQRQREEQDRAELRASARKLDPKQLQKDPDRYAGETVVMTGQIFQIQEGGDENFFLMNTECETEYDVTICDGPIVHVTYDMSTDKTEEDIVTVYGTVIGGYEYETQIGGFNYVGSIQAEIIE